MNIEDRRGRGFPAGARFPIGAGGARRGGIGIVGLIAIALLALVFGVDPRVLLQGGGGGMPPPQTPEMFQPRETSEMSEFVSVVVADTEDTWHSLFATIGRPYEEPTLVLFSGAVNSACGFAQAAVGPFYCPGDRKVYLDLGFFEELQHRFGAPGDFARAYVIAHEIGHHVQTLLGVSQQVRNMQQQVGPDQANALSVRLELQADCFAGLWAHHAQAQRQILEPGDIEEGLGAASAVGDDRLQQQARGPVAPDSFTHGSSAQRTHWFERGFESGSLEACDTFGAERL